jgi:hypothetical protein
VKSSLRPSSSGRVRNLSILRPLALKVGTSGERPPGGLNSRAFVDELPPPPLPLDAGEVLGCGIASRRNSSYFTSLASNCTDVRIAADLAAEICVVVVVPFEGGDSSFGDSSSAGASRGPPPRLVGGLSASSGSASGTAASLRPGKSLNKLLSSLSHDRPTGGRDLGGSNLFRSTSAPRLFRMRRAMTRGIPSRPPPSSSVSKPSSLEPSEMSPLS